ncbi:MAG TPA: hypothetical protein VIY08_13870 [Candidatus Nitrosocosmicus sp.]
MSKRKGRKRDIGAGRPFKLNSCVNDILRHFVTNTTCLDAIPQHL